MVGPVSMPANLSYYRLLDEFSDAATPAGPAGRRGFHCLDLVIYRV